MPYEPYMKELIKKVEATRSARIQAVKEGKHFPRLSGADGMKLMKEFHPDYKERTKRQLAVGPSKGKVVPNELADVLEARSSLNSGNFDLSRIDYDVDVLIIGGGGAGSAAALVAQEHGARVLIATKLRHGDANSMMAEGGIQAADKPNDSPAIHFLDVIGGGHFTNHPDLVKTLTRNAPSVIQWLEGLGMMFDKDRDGTMRTLHGGGTSRKRLHSAGDTTGAEIMRTLRDEVRNRTDIQVIEFAPALELLMDPEGRSTGAILFNFDTEKYTVARAKTTILATGGLGRLHVQGFPTTNHYGATADGLVLAYRAGASLCFLEATQFHPTGAIFPEQNVGLLITEKFRGAGAQLLNADGEQFVYPLETRDVESSAIIRECSERNKGIRTPTGRFGVWLDSPMIEVLKGPGTVVRDFPAKYRQFGRHGIDISKEPMLIYPTLHYQNGGITINSNAETEIPNLYAAGEVAGGIHGTNRLMGNSLLDITVFGRIAGKNAAEKAEQTQPGELTLRHVQKFHEELERAGVGDGRISPILLPDYVGKIG